MDDRPSQTTRSHDPGATARMRLPVRDDDGAVFSAEVYRCVNVTTDPDLREPLVAGELFEVEGPDEKTYRLAIPIRYHDEQRRLFALVIPEALRHREFALRRELLDELADAGRNLPSYMRAFDTVVGPGGLGRLIEDAARSDESPGEGDEEADDEATQEARGELRKEREQLEEKSAAVEAERAELEDLRSELDEEHAALERQLARLEQERSALEQKEAELEQTRASLERERAALSEERSEVEAMRLDVEQQWRRLEQAESSGAERESTEVVSDSQFIEIIDEQEIEQEVDAESASAPAVERRSSSALPAGFELTGARRVAKLDDEIVAGAAVEPAVFEAIEEADQLSFFVQYDDEHGYPLVCLLLAALDDDRQELASVGWTLDVDSADDRAILDELTEEVRLAVALFDDEETDDEPRAFYRVDAPLETNLGWIRRRTRRALESSGEAYEDVDAAAQSWRSGPKGRLEQMRHNFTSKRFDAISGLADLALATGVIGFWSTPERFEYLVAHRSFALDRFEEMRERVVRRAVEHGLYLNEALREVAVDLDLAADETELVERLIAEFVEVNVGLRKNDLDPLKEWENWEALVEEADELGVQVDPDVLELAEASLKRARRFQQTAPSQPA